MSKEQSDTPPANLPPDFRLDHRWVLFEARIRERADTMPFGRVGVVAEFARDLCETYPHITLLDVQREFTRRLHPIVFISARVPDGLRALDAHKNPKPRQLFVSFNEPHVGMAEMLSNGVLSWEQNCHLLQTETGFLTVASKEEYDAWRAHQRSINTRPTG
jgi:hypothetical protein